MFVLDSSVEVASGSIECPVHDSDWARVTFSWSIKISPPGSFHDDPEKRKNHIVPIRLIIDGDHLYFSWQGKDKSNASFSASEGPVRISVPYEAIDGLIEALQRAKAAVPGIVEKAYQEHDDWQKRNEELNKRHSLTPRAVKSD